MTYAKISFTSISNFKYLEPLSPEAEQALSQYIFKSESLQGDCKKFQTFAKKVSSLKELEKKYMEREIGFRDKAIAVAKCIALAVAIAAFFALTFSPVFLLITAPGTVLSIKAILSPILLGCSGAALSILGLLSQCEKAFHIFKRPSLEEVKADLAGKNLEVKSPEDLRRLKNIKTELERQLQAELNNPNKAAEEAKEAEFLGAEDNLKAINNKKDRLIKALEEVSRMYDALLYRARVAA